MCLQTNNFFGKLLMWTTFAGVAFIRSTKDLDQYKELLKEVCSNHAALCIPDAHYRPPAGHLLRQAVVRHLGGR